MLLNITIVLIFSIINIALAKIDAWKISRGRRIYHGINASLYLILVTILYIWTKNEAICLGVLAVRRIVFDTALNLFRGLRFDYISRKTTSIIDRISYKFQAQFGYIPYYGIFFIIIILSIVWQR